MCSFLKKKKFQTLYMRDTIFVCSFFFGHIEHWCEHPVHRRHRQRERVLNENPIFWLPRSKKEARRRRKRLKNHIANIRVTAEGFATALNLFFIIERLNINFRSSPDGKKLFFPFSSSLTHATRLFSHLDSFGAHKTVCSERNEEKNQIRRLL